MKIFVFLLEKYGKKRLIAAAVAMSVLLISSITVPVVIINSGDCEHIYDSDCDTDCNECGEKRAALHSFEEATCSMPKTCSLCGVTEGEMLGHNWQNANCTAAKTCIRCGEREGDALGHSINTDDGDCSTSIVCTECGTVITAARSHDFSNEWQKDENSHWHICKNVGCNVTDEKKNHTSSGSATEMSPEVCTVCDYMITPALEHIHSYNTKKYDETNHWEECQCGEKINLTLHSAIADDGDCTTAITCNDCFYVVTAGKLSHTPNNDDEDCTTSVKCIFCDKVIVAEKIHDYTGDWQSNATQHWHTCGNLGCTVTETKSEHNKGIDGRCTDCKYILESILPSHEHIWGIVSYKWNSDYSVCVAARTCTSDANHKETENGIITSQITEHPTCTSKGKTAYTATFTNIAFATQTKTVEDIPVSTEHTWSAATYEWNTDHTVCSATRACTIDESHKETENGTVISDVTKDANCTEKGQTTYTASFENNAFVTQTKTVEDIPISTDHTWGTSTYEWNADNTICTATITCILDENHKKTENAVITKSTEGNCDIGGTHTYTATFIGTEFDIQIKTENFEAGHDYKITYRWEYGGAVCHAKQSCYNCEDTTKDEIAMREAVVITVTGDCSTGGTLTRTATFADSAFETQTKTEAFSAGEHIFRAICSTQCESCEETVRTVEASEHTILRPYTNFECDVCMKGSTLEGWAPDSDDSEFG